MFLLSAMILLQCCGCMFCFCMQMHSLRLIVTVTHVGGDAIAVAYGDVGKHCVDFAGFVFPV